MMKANLTGAGLIPVQHKVVRTTVTHTDADGKSVQSEVKYVDIDDDGKFSAADTVVVMDLNQDGKLDLKDAADTARMLDRQSNGRAVQDGQIVGDDGRPLQVHLVSDRDGDGVYQPREITAAGPKLSWLGPEGAELMVVDTSQYKPGVLPSPTFNNTPGPFSLLTPLFSDSFGQQFSSSGEWNRSGF